MQFYRSCLGLALLSFWQCSISALALAQTPQPTALETPKPYINLKLVTLVSGIKEPVSITHIPGKPNTLYVTERKGNLRIIKDGKLLRSPILEIEDYVDTEGPLGFQGVAFPKDFASSRLVFANYIDKQGDMVIASFKAADDEDDIDPETIAVRLKIVQPFGLRNSSQIAFGPDGNLYLSIADNPSTQGPKSFAQDLKSLFGKVLRITVSAPEKYAIPTDNPYFNHKENAPEIWATGFRRPGKPVFDPSGAVYVSDTDLKHGFEFNRLNKGENYGWDTVAGDSCAQGELCSKNGITAAAFFAQAEGTGEAEGRVYRGNAIPELVGKIVFVDRESTKLFALEKDHLDIWKREVVVESQVKLVALGEDSQGELYVASNDGHILRLQPE